ncbi:DUF1648 domain-containing protein [Clostridium sp. LP20]|uniref:DUF1648 domain-containing protein n=1 Tax=Clostridium sp. LP20 TaxID=3418665 RepID=UPI003EE5DA33
MEAIMGIGTFLIVYGVLMYQGYNLDKIANTGIIYGVRVPEDHKNDNEIIQAIKRYKKRYILIIPITILITLGISLIVDSVAMLVFSLFIILILSQIVYLFSWKEMKEIKRRNKWRTIGSNVVVVDMRVKKKNGEGIEKQPLSSKIYLWIIPIIAITIIMTIVLYGRLPEVFPIHFNGNGIADRYSVKGTFDGYFSLAILPLTQIGILLMLWGTHIYTLRAKKILNSGTVKATLKQQNTYRRYMVIYLFAIALEMEIMFAIIQVTLFYPRYAGALAIVSTIIILATCIGGIIPIYRIGQGGRNIKVEDDGEMIYRDDDDLYKLGSFYYNKEDPAIMVQKRIGIGMDFNYAKPIAWVFVAITIIIVLGVLIVTIMNDQSILNI